MSGEEFDVIDRYFARIGWQSGQVDLGPGDDCALLRVPEQHQLCVSTDTLISGVHYPEGSTGDVVAHRSVVANLSDLSAMGAQPLGFLIALTLPEVDHPWLRAFSDRIARLSDQYRIPLVGGNMSRGKLSVTITVMGAVPVGDALTRQGAKPGDGVFATGYLGEAAAGLLATNKNDMVQDALISAYCFPQARLDFGQRIRDTASACIDISDGLLADAGHLAESSGVGVCIQTGQLFVSEALGGYLGEEPSIDMILHGGDDYELCFSAPLHKQDVLAAFAAESETPLSLIGEVVTDPGLWLCDRDGTRKQASVRGYQHF
jgi:thiamine-monophosphate kinase